MLRYQGEWCTIPSSNIYLDPISLIFVDFINVFSYTFTFKQMFNKEWRHDNTTEIADHIQHSTGLKWSPFFVMLTTWQCWHTKLKTIHHIKLNNCKLFYINLVYACTFKQPMTFDRHPVPYISTFQRKIQKQEIQSAYITFRWLCSITG